LRKTPSAKKNVSSPETVGVLHNQTTRREFLSDRSHPGRLILPKPEILPPDCHSRQCGGFLLMDEEFDSKPVGARGIRRRRNSRRFNQNSLSNRSNASDLYNHRSVREFRAGIMAGWKSSSPATSRHQGGIREGIAVPCGMHRLRRTFMPRFGKWLLTLGLMAATPAAALSAGPFDTLPQGQPPAANANQKVAVEIANALRAARLNSYEMDVEYSNGVCTLSGKIGTPQQKVQATQVVSRVQGVTQVVNRLQPLSAAPADNVRNAAYNPVNRRAQSGVQPAGASRGAAPAGNQQTANAIAMALKSAGLSGYDMEIRYQNGIAVLSGSITSPRQAALASQVVSQVPGVRGVNNQLRVTSAARQPMPRQPIQPAVAWQNGGGIPAPMSYMHGGPGARQTVYNNPNLPEYAWPTYASYPNSAQITYPKQYSASAWPYIGPFYPYPQVPMGWRKASLEWDDGYWALSFNSRTDRWWWFLNPKNW
jgi:osmotically-inducible protein OsmY